MVFDVRDPAVAEAGQMGDDEVGAGPGQAQVSLTGSMLGEWSGAFGLKALTLRDVTLSVGGKGSGGGSAARAASP